MEDATQRGNDSQPPYEKKHVFFQAPALSLYKTLIKLLGEDFIVFAKVRVSDVLVVTRDTEPDTKQRLLQNVRNKHLDFVLCDAKDLRLFGAIVLDNHPNRVGTNTFLSHAFHEARLPLLRLEGKADYAEEEVAEHLKNTFGLFPDESTQLTNDLVFQALETETEIGEPKVVEIHLEPLEEFESESEKQAHEHTLCPKCSSPMVLRKAHKGKRAGAYFLTCSTYPICKRAIPFNR